MASLRITTNGFQNQILELRLGVNRCGRAPGNDFLIDHSTVSGWHCEIMLSDGDLVLRDCGSTNGTFLDGARVQEVQLHSGQVVRVGDIEMVVETTDVKVSIPKIEVQVPAPPVVLADGSTICRRHPKARVTHQCTHCHELLCDECVHRLRRRGGKVWKFCALCSRLCEPIGGEKKKKKTLFGFLHKTVKLPFAKGPKKKEIEEAAE